MDEFEQATATEAKEETASEAEAATETQEFSEQSKPEQTVEELRKELAAVTKERNDLKGQTVGRQRAAERDAALREEIGGLKKTINALLKDRMASGESDDLGQQIQSIEQETASAVSERQWGSIYAKASEALNTALKDDDGKQVIEASSPELAEARSVWAAAKEEKDPEGLLEALHMANRVRLAVERKQAQEAAKAKPEEEEGKLEMATVPGGPAAAMSEQEWLNRFADEVNGDIPATPDNLKKAQDLMSKGLRPRSR